MKLVNVPTLIIHGDEDKTVPIDPTGKQSAKVIPDSTFIVYEGAPHGLFYTERKKLNADLVNFLVTQANREFFNQPDVNTPVLAD